MSSHEGVTSDVYCSLHIQLINEYLPPTLLLFCGLLLRAFSKWYTKLQQLGKCGSEIFKEQLFVFRISLDVLDME